VRIFPFLPLFTNDVEWGFCELRCDGVLRSSSTPRKKIFEKGTYEHSKFIGCWYQCRPACSSVRCERRTNPLQGEDAKPKGLLEMPSEGSSGGDVPSHTEEPVDPRPWRRRVFGG
jgi:hypothetical protein